MSRYTLLSFVRDIDRASRSAAYQRRVAENRQIRAHERMRALAERERKTETREQKARYVAERAEAVQELNDSLAERLESLNDVLEQTLSVDDKVEFDSLLTKSDFPSFSPPKELAEPAKVPERQMADFRIRPLNFIEKWFRSKRVEKQERIITDKQREYDTIFARASTYYEATERERIARLQKLDEEYRAHRETFLKQVAEKNAELESFKAQYRMGAAQAIEAYCSLVLDRSKYEVDFPIEHEVRYVADSKTLHVSKLLPSVSIVPAVAEYKYVKSSDTVTEKPRSKADTKGVYSAIVCQVALRTVHEMIEADQGNWIAAVEFFGYIKATDPAKGGEWTPVITKLLSSAAAFNEIKLEEVDPTICFAGLGGKMARLLDGTIALC